MAKLKISKGWKNTLKRAGRTFFQASVGYVVINIQAMASAGFVDEQSRSIFIKSVIVGAVASGLSALMNLPSKSEEA